ncbi:MAG: hypothetical protein GY940_24245, partial [bacterium]|nr:hypothetical protein [bacterium]
MKKYSILLLLLLVGVFAHGQSWPVIKLEPQATPPTNAFWSDGSLYRDTAGNLWHKDGGTWSIIGSGAAPTLQDEGSPMTGRPNTNFVGAGVQLTDDAANDATIVTIGGGAAPVTSVNTQTGAVVLDADDIDDAATTNKYTTAAEISKLAGIETAATADQNANEVPNTPAGNLSATDVQAALNELQGDIDNVGDGSTNLGYTDATRILTSDTGTDVTLPLANGTNPGLMQSADYNKLLNLDAADVANTPAGNLTAATVQNALNELQTELDGVTGGSTDDQTLAEVLTEGNNAGSQDITGVDHITVTGISLQNGDINNPRHIEIDPTDIEPPLIEGSLYADNSENRLKFHDGTGLKKILLDGDVIAADVVNTPSGNLSGTNVQAALNELQTELDGAANANDISGSGNRMLFADAGGTINDVDDIIIINSNQIKLTDPTGIFNQTITPYGNFITSVDETNRWHIGNRKGYTSSQKDSTVIAIWPKDDKSQDSFQFDYEDDRWEIGDVEIATGAGGVSLSDENVWTAVQHFNQGLTGPAHYIGMQEGLSGKRWRFGKSTDELVIALQQTAATDEGGIYPTLYSLNSTGTPSANSDLIDVEYFNDNVGGGTDDQTAAEVPNTPSGNLVATDVQAALNELQTELDGANVPYVNVMDHGAAADGSTDDSAAFAAAFAAGNNVYVPAGSYVANFSMVSNQTLHGDGRESTILIPPAGATETILIDASTVAKSTIVIKDLQLLNSNSVANCTGIDFKGDDVNDVNDFHSIENIRIKDFDTGIDVSGRLVWTNFDNVYITDGRLGYNINTDPANAAFNQIKFTNCETRLMTEEGVIMTGYSKTVSFDTCNFELMNTDDTIGEAAVYVENSRNILFENCYFEANGDGAAVDTVDPSNNTFGIHLSGTFSNNP